ncbi:MAG: NADH-quinone oxidoreductase subunit H [Sporomusaceae bacterium]|nr:NADH-quinone oxidoreductase subunit H [Sporomusaceae bacterium]
MMIVVERMLAAFFLIGLAPLVLGMIKLVKARLQNRRGPRLWQPYLDIGKLLQKEEVVSPTTSWVFRMAPFAYLTTAAAAAALLPLPGADPDHYDVLLLLYLLAAGRFALVLASLDAGSAFGGMGGSREMYLSVLVEPALMLAFFTLAAPAGSTGLGALAAQAAAVPFSLPYVFAALAFFVLLLAETGRVPVDNPDTHLELTMIHEGMLLEYSGRRLGLLHLAAAVRQLIVIILFAIYFIPWQIGGGLLALALKVAGTAAVLALTESCTNKMRLFRLPHFLAISGLLSLLALVAQ